MCNGCGVVRRVLMERATRTIMLAQATVAGTVGQHSALLRPPLAMKCVRLRVKTDVVKRHRPCAGIRSVSVPEIEEMLQDPAPSSRGDVRARQRELCARPTQASRGGEERRRRPGDRHRKDANGRRVNPASVAGAGGGWQARLAGALDNLLHLEQRHTDLAIKHLALLQEHNLVLERLVGQSVAGAPEVMCQAVQHEQNHTSAGPVVSVVTTSQGPAGDSTPHAIVSTADKCVGEHVTGEAFLWRGIWDL